MDIPKTHPRYGSLTTRERLVELASEGLVSTAGLIAHGRGEAFDYLLGEETIPPARRAERAAAGYLLEAENPVLSVNGNAAALAAEELVELAKAVPAKIEVNLFHRSEERMRTVVQHMEEAGAGEVLGLEPDRQIPGLDHSRGKAESGGIYSADVVLVPLEDGDRCQALVGMGKTVITIDLNPLSRTSRTASVSVVDEVTRAVPNITGHARELRETGGADENKSAGEVVSEYDNRRVLAECVRYISKRLEAEFGREV